MLKLKPSLILSLLALSFGAHVASTRVLFAKDAAGVDLPQITTVSKLAHDSSLRTPGGSELEVLQFDGPKDPSFRFLVQGGLHGNEEQASEFVRWMARRYAHGESLLNQLPRDEVQIDFLPVANPDGQLEKSRYNTRGVNLNRNFAVLWGITKENPGAASFSEPETRAIRSLFALRKYSAAVDVHGYINWVVAPSEPEAVIKRGLKPTRERVADYKRWRGGLREEMRLLPGYQLKTGAGLGDGGAFEDWAFWSQGTFAYCLEMETFQRFVRSYRRDFNDLNGETGAQTVDLFKRYEAFIYRTFARALELKKTAPAATNVAGQ